MAEKKVTLIDIEKISGIGPVLSESFRNRNFRYTRDLLRRSISSVSDSLESIQGISRADIQNKFIPQARLLELPGVTPVLASHLVQKNYRGYDNIAWVDENLLRSAVNEILPDFGDYQIAQMRMEALRRMSTCSLFMRVVSSDGKPVSNAEVHISNPFPTTFPHAAHWLSDVEGMVYADYIVPRRVNCAVIADGFLSQKSGLGLQIDKPVTYAIRLEKGASEAVVYDEFKSGRNPYLDRMAVKRSTVNLADLPSNAVFEFVGADEKGATLICLQRRHVKGHAERYITSASLGSAFAEAGRGAIMRRDSGGNWSVVQGATAHNWHTLISGGQ